jgi:hypothetical protein
VGKTNKEGLYCGLRGKYYSNKKTQKFLTENFSQQLAVPKKSAQPEQSV